MQHSFSTVPYLAKGVLAGVQSMTCCRQHLNMCMLKWLACPQYMCIVHIFIAALAAGALSPCWSANGKSVLHIGSCTACLHCRLGWMLAHTKLACILAGSALKCQLDELVQLCRLSLKNGAKTHPCCKATQLAALSLTITWGNVCQLYIDQPANDISAPWPNLHKSLSLKPTA